MSQNPSPRLPPIPGYEVEELVGSGGMGIVYRARHLATNRLVALKLIGPRGAGDEIARERFVREVHALAKIKHANVVPVFDAGEWHGFPYCTMEFVAGGTLSNHLERFRTDHPSAVRLLAKVARGVQALHDARIIHRDLKPLNILIGPGDEPLVADFGLAKCLGDESDLTLTELPVGTRQYMAPEQTIGRRQDYTPACDVWALGVTLYEVLIGRRPFAHDGQSDVYHAIRTADPVPPAELSPDVPTPLQTIVLKCLAKQPEDRYQSATDLSDDLERWLRGDPILATPPLPSAIAEPHPVAEQDPVQQPKPVPAQPRPKRRARVFAALAVVTLVLGVLSATKPPKRTISERIAAGETVALTDDKGFPLVEPVDEPEHGMLRDTVDGYHLFSRPGTGITSLLDQPLPHDYRVEAELGTTFHTYPGARAGIYVGRQLWGGLPFKHESFFAATIGPANTNKERQLVSTIEKYWWMRHENGGASNNGRWTNRWHPENKDAKLRFAKVRLDVRGDTLEGTIDGHPIRPLSTKTIEQDLNSTIFGYQLNSGFPQYECTSPYLGPGIGVFCVHCDCVVRNLTVTKLAPKP